MTLILNKFILSSLIGLAVLGAHAETRAIIDTNMGAIEVMLDEQKAPKSVANFVQYANKGFYNNTIFHRVIDGFMIQGGGFDANMVQKATDKAIINEANNGLNNQVGTIAMARTAAPNSATSQFFINVADNDFLNHQNNTAAGYGYAVFGKVIKGMEVVNHIAKVKTTNQAYHQNVPVTPVLINKVSIIKE